MKELTVNLNLPSELLGVLDVPEAGLELRLLEIIAIELFREGLISSEQGGLISGKTTEDFIKLLAVHCIPSQQDSADPLARLKRSPLIGSFKGDSDLSEQAEAIFQDVLNQTQ